MANLKVYLCIFIYLFIQTECKSNKLSRRKRYVAFPEGASFSAVYCATYQMGITDGAQIFTEGLNWGLVYDLPNDTKPFFDKYGPAQKRRNRRDLYSKVENVLTSMGYNGKSCILRSVCEASRHLKAREDSLLFHIVGLIFRFPTEPILTHEPDDHRIYHWASEVGRNGIAEENNEIPNNKCSDVFHCPFSLIDMALGHHSAAGVFPGNADTDNDYVY